jgi:hypothetical protein
VLRDKNPIVPQIIRDAIRLTELLEEKFLWINALCILEDDVNDRRAQIAFMDRIYGSVTLTICAVAGDHANYGPSRMRIDWRKSARRHRKQIQGLTLATTLRKYKETIPYSI